MAYSNHTTNYELPQYVGTDKPSYLNDFNYAMSTIDGQMKTNANGVQSAQSTANGVDTKVGALTDLTTTSKTSIVSAINEVKGESSGVGNLTNLTTTNKSSCVGAINEVNANVKNFNLSHYTKFTDTSVLTKTNCTVSDVNLTLATNNDDSIFKFYGSVSFTATGSGGVAVDIVVPTNISGVTEEYEIYPMGFVAKGNPSNNNGAPYCNAFVQTDGKIRLHYWAGSNRDAITLFPIPFIIFNKNFGDYDPTA